ncbi:MAG: ribosomal-protein-alanine acetyltransferase, partial [Deltaproteobacteria bacterium]|nr:ribosomal-protein-alanine acetyltransferase [Deltaproteobacteria bacterium]
MERRDQIEIRRMLRKDLEDVLAIEKISFPAPWSRFLFEQEFLFPHAHLLAAGDLALPGRVWGYLCFWLVAEETHILNLAVHPQWRCRGVGSRLLEYVVDYSRAKGVEEIFLEVRRSNHRAISVYRRFHFQPLGIRPRYYQDSGEDAIIMGLRLPDPSLTVTDEKRPQRNQREN